jgi:hypothetical protein
MGGGGIVPTPTPNSDPVVFLPPGVDPYYGLTISNLAGSTGGNTYIPPDEQDWSGDKSSSGLNISPTNTPEYRTYLNISPTNNTEYRTYLNNGGTLPYNDWYLLTNGSTNTNTSGSTVKTGFQIATPNMTWANSLPTVMPAGGDAAAQQYGPMPFTREANTPGVTYNPPPLTYFNPYNTNPYLPTSNPFALVPNNTGTTQ